ncbi:hypothetical protein BD779DRAFT_1453053, partial [Infundibulicybe gibba]
VPNILLSHHDQHHMIRVFFPGLYSPTRENLALTKEEREEWYNRVIYPAMSDAFPQSTTSWPPEYSAEIFRARTHGGHIVNSGHGVPASNVSNLSDIMRIRMELIPWGRLAFFGVQYRGTKDVSYHGARSQRYAQQALDIYLQGIVLHPRDTWYIDIGMEFSRTGCALLWRTDAHNILAADLLKITAEEASQLVRPGRNCRRDLGSHLTQISGLRVKLPEGCRNAGLTKTIMFQAYTTDKALTYHPERGHYGKFLTGQMVLNSPGVPIFCENLLDAYTSASRNMDVAARVEVRVPLSKAVSALLALEDHTIIQSLVMFSRTVWWYVAFQCRSFWTQGHLTHFPTGISEASVYRLSNQCSTQ